MKHEAQKRCLSAKTRKVQTGIPGEHDLQSLSLRSRVVKRRRREWCYNNQMFWRMNDITVRGGAEVRI